MAVGTAVAAGTTALAMFLKGLQASKALKASKEPQGQEGLTGQEGLNQEVDAMQLAQPGIGREEVPVDGANVRAGFQGASVVPHVLQAAGNLQQVKDLQERQNRFDKIAAESRVAEKTDRLANYKKLRQLGAERGGELSRSLTEHMRNRGRRVR